MWSAAWKATATTTAAISGPENGWTRRKQILDTIGIGGHRVRMCNLSSSDGPLFVKYAEEVHAKILEAGPNPIKRAAKSKAPADSRPKAAAQR